MVFLGNLMDNVALVTSLLSAILLIAGTFYGRKNTVKGKMSVRIGYILMAITALALTIGVAIIVVGFFTHNMTISYVAQNYPKDIGSLFWLYKLSGLWAGRAGSLLFWTWIMALFGLWITWRGRKLNDELLNVTVAVIGIVIMFFMTTMVFSVSNAPFMLTPAEYLDADGNLTGRGLEFGMNILLQHWAMTLHPPALFIGYAGMVVPFAFGLSSLIIGDSSKRWVESSNRISLFAFVFLTIGIGLGAIWAYVVLGWGGYWGWDPVENASLLSWLTGLAMRHSFTVVRKRNTYQGWALMLATFTYIFVVLGTFITRSGIVDSVHAFSVDKVSTLLFASIMIIALLATSIGIWYRHDDFNGEDEYESILTKNGSYYLTNIIMLFSAILLAYMTLAPSFPEWLPLGQNALGTGAYEVIARPLGILFLLLAAVCPLLAWNKRQPQKFKKNIKVPGIISIVLFAVLAYYWATYLVPTYNAVVEKGGVNSVSYLEQGPAFYYNGLALVGFAVASLLICVSLYLLVSGVRARHENKGENWFKATAKLFTLSPAQAGGYLTHFGMGIILIGLVGSAMYVTDETYSLTAGSDATIEVGHYTLEYQGESKALAPDGGAIYSVLVEPSIDGKTMKDMEPNIWVPATVNMDSQKLNAAVSHRFTEDLFVVFQGYNADKSVSLNVKINPLISFVWAGFAIMVIGIIAALIPPRAKRGNLKIVGRN